MSSLVNIHIIFFLVSTINITSNYLLTFYFTSKVNEIKETNTHTAEYKAEEINYTDDIKLENNASSHINECIATDENDVSSYDGI